MKFLHLLAAATLATASPARDTAPATDAIEFILYEDGGTQRPSRLKTAVVEMRSPSGHTVDLVGAIHIADQSYYDGLNERFRTYDAVLYELITDGPPGAPEEGSDGTDEDADAHSGTGAETTGDTPAAGRGTDAIHFFQVLLKNALGLTYQTEVIDYTPEHFIHADMNLHEFDTSMKNRGETLQSIFEDAFRAQMATDNNTSGSDFSALFSLFSGGDNSELKRELATLMASSVIGITETIEADRESTLIGARNAVATDTLKATLSSEDPPAKTAVFYGAAHLPGIIDLLAKEGFSHKSTGWLTAWEIAAPEPAEEE